VLQLGERIARCSRTAPDTPLSGARSHFRLALAGACAVSRIEVEVAAGGGRARTALCRRLCPGDALEIDTGLLAGGQPIWFPIR
jgi:hypothetical protein